MMADLYKSKLLTAIAVVILFVAFVLPVVTFHGVLNDIYNNKNTKISTYMQGFWRVYQIGRYKSPNILKEENNLRYLAKSYMPIALPSLPIWYVSLDAPQYPRSIYKDGVIVYMHFDGVSGEVEEMDTLNHYIGMKSMWVGGNFAKAVAPYFLLIVMLIMIYYIIYDSKYLNYLLLVPIFIPVMYMVIFSYTMYNFGHQLVGDEASITLAPFTPTILGEGKVAQFYTHSYPTTGFYLLLLISLLLVASIYYRAKHYRVKHWSYYYLLYLLRH